MAEAAPSFIKEERACIIRPAMRHSVAHLLYKRQRNAPALRRTILPNSANTTHENSSVQDFKFETSNNDASKATSQSVLRTAISDVLRASNKNSSKTKKA